jgi:L,D-transpeptidase catalytic domain
LRPQRGENRQREAPPPAVSRCRTGGFVAFLGFAPLARRRSWLVERLGTNGTRMMMLARLIAGLALSVALLAAPTGASANPSWDPEGRFSGGSPTGGQGNWNMGGGGFGSGGFMGRSGPITRSTVSYPGRHAPGTIVINTSERRLYYMLGNGQALRYGIGVGRIGFTWGGVKHVSSKREWPDWTPPAQMLRRRPDLPRHMRGGLDNPLGARALYLGSSLYRIHGSNEPETIGQAVSSGCFRMTNEDVIDLYNRTRIGTKVIVLR